ncbi:MAG TPA: hypothetical protein VN131_04025, partial [Mobilitalea sp.]|nr:hypothetical protein [Mobilitalea sp.]
KVALVNIPSGVQVIKNMLTKDKVSSELRELEYSVINLNSNVVSNDTVDVRICYPNGESYVVLSKKVIKGVDTETSICFLWLEEEEILRMSAAIVDAGLYPGAKLYVTKYIEPSIQEASIVNYTPSLSILSMIEQDPNIVDRYSQELSKEVRKALENRLASSMETDVSSISWEVSSENQFLSSPSPTPVPPIASEDEPAPTSEPEIAKNPAASGTSGELGSTQDYLYYAQEKEAKDGVVEYGE